MKTAPFTQAERSRAHLLSSSDTNSAFGKIYVLNENGKLRIDLTIRETHGSEGWHTGVALDGSRSMQQSYGRGLVRSSTLTKDVYLSYVERGLIQKVHEDGKDLETWKKEAFNDAIEKGHMSYTKNEVGPLVKELAKYLLDEIESGNGVDIIYWACGKSGDQIEPLALISDENLSSIDINGPKTFGAKTYLQPAMDYFLKANSSKQKSLLLFITDGRIEDMNSIIKSTIDLAQQISAGERSEMKCVLIGVGPEIDQHQFEQLDNLDTGTDVDIWDQKIAKEMRDLSEIVAEVVSEATLIASTASIFSGDGKMLCRFHDGLSARVSFEVPFGVDTFILDANGIQIAQKIHIL